jgi:dolichyl-phosphate beta-glucosyltransferase
MSENTALIVPCYNEELRINANEFLSFISNSSGIDLWFVDDGSKYKTFEVIQGLADQHPERIFAVKLSENKGKAEAIRTCLLSIAKDDRYQYIGYIDADLSAPIHEVIALNTLISEGRHLIVAGSRVKMAGRKIERNLFRYYISRIFATYYSQLLGVHNYDTQCGLKLLTTPFASKLFEAPFESRWLFDLELFLRAQIALGEEAYSRQVFELPLNAWKEIGGSKLKLFDFIKAPIEVLKIYNRYRRR